MSKIGDIISTLRGYDQYEANVGQKLDYLRTTKQKIGEAIEECEVNVPEGASFFSFGALIRQIKGAYDAMRRTTPATYTRTSPTAANYSTPSNVGAGKYDMDSAEQEEKPLLAGRATTNKTWMDISTDPQNKDGRYYGYSQMVVNVTDAGSLSEGPFTVTFKDGATELYSDTDVPMMGSAVFKGSYPTREGKVFTGWDPKPIEVICDMEVQPTFRDDTPIAGSGYIEDSWETICANGGAKYPIGSWKELHVNGYTIPDTNVYFASVNDSTHQGSITKYKASKSNTLPDATYYMTKVYEGEDGSTSTWITCNPSKEVISGAAYQLQTSYKTQNSSGAMTQEAISNYGGFTASDFIIANSFKGMMGLNGMSEYTQSTWPDFPAVQGQGETRITRGYYNSKFRDDLNGCFFDAFPDCLKKSIKSVSKFSAGMGNPYNRNPGEASDVVYEDIEVIDKIWPVSLKEICITDEGKGIQYPFFKDKQQATNEHPYITYSINSTSTTRDTLFFTDMLANDSNPYGSYNASNIANNTNYHHLGSITFGFCLTPTSVESEGNNDSEETPETQGDQNGNS